MNNSNFPKLENLKIHGIPPFAQDIEFAFDDSVNVFIGSNGTGKSTVMRLLAVDFPNRGIPGFKDDGWAPRIKGQWPRNPDGSTNVRAVPQAYFPPVRVGMPVGINTRVFQIQSRLDDDWDEIMSASPLIYFDGSRVYHAMQKLYREDLFGIRNRTRAATVAFVAYECVKDICKEMIKGEVPRNIRTFENLENRREHESSLLPESLLNQPIEHYAMGVDTVEDHSETLYIGELSTGTQGIYLWVLYLALKLARQYNFEEGWQKSAGIAFIDEIENHLHPKWQRRVIPALQNHFPGVQIFATTHSPFVVAGLKRGQIHKLYREGGVIRTPRLSDEEKSQAIVGWTVEEILREFMEVDDPTDEPTANAAATLRWLRYQRPSGGKAESWRQEKIALLKDAEFPGSDEIAALNWLENHTVVRGDAAEWWEMKIDELQNVVRRDVEAGGPIAAQRELFMEQLQELLRDVTGPEENTEGVEG